MNEILLNIESKERRMALLKSGALSDLFVERKKSRQITGNIYRGRVTNILDNIQSAFIDISEGDNGFIHISDILENTKKLESSFDMDFDFEEEESAKKKTVKPNLNIDQLLKMDQPVLVQVVKEPIGSKGARLTSNVSIAGRYLVLLPNTPHRGVSRKIEDRQERAKLKKLIRAFEMPQEIGLICRTASRTATSEMLIEEATELLKAWSEIVVKFNESSGSELLYEESDLIKRAVIMAVDKKMHRILVDEYNTYKQCCKIYSKYADEHTMRIEYYRDKIPMYERFGIEREIERTLYRKIWMASGGYLFFERTEAMWTIDVNSGRSKNISGNLEEVIARINIEAASEICRQLRLRNIGGLVICDFIDMRSRKNKRRLLDKMKEGLKEDTAKCTVLRMSEFGLIEMTRQRNRESLMQTMFSLCPYCQGRGNIKSNETVSIEIERALKKVILHHQQYGIRLVCHPVLDEYLQGTDRRFLLEMSEELNAKLEFGVDDTLHVNEFKIFSIIDDKLINP